MHASHVLVPQQLKYTLLIEGSITTTPLLIQILFFLVLAVLI